MRVARVLAVVMCLCWHIPQAQALISDVAADFSSTDNPNGVWRYGWSLTLGSPFILSTAPRVLQGLDVWRIDLPDFTGELHNGTDSLIIVNTSAHYEPGQFVFHPGPAGEYAVVRYTAPEAGELSIASVFTGQDIASTSTDVHVLFNGRSLFDGLVEGFGSTRRFDTNLAVLPGETIDFAVGVGRNGTYFNDSTALAATISPVPEPSTLTLLGLGMLLGLCSYADLLNRCSRLAATAEVVE